MITYRLMLNQPYRDVCLTKRLTLGPPSIIGRARDGIMGMGRAAVSLGRPFCSGHLVP